MNEPRSVTAPVDGPSGPDGENLRASRGRAGLLVTGPVFALVLLTATACSQPGQGCTKVGGISAIRITVEPGIRARLASLRLELCQEAHCGNIAFPATSSNKYGIHVQKGVGLHTNTFEVDLSALGHDWDADTKARLIVLGMSAGGTTALRHTETFEFTKNYPNGEQCDPEAYLRHSTRVEHQDLTMSPG